MTFLRPIKQEIPIQFFFIKINKMLKRTFFILSAILLLSFNSCVDKAEPIADIKIRENDEAIQTYLKSKNITAISAGSGIYYTITQKNDAGRKPISGDLMSYHFQTSLLTGLKIDSTSRLENKPNYSPYGTENNLWGLFASVIKEGERATFFLPYSFGYGAEATSKVPAYSPIIMDFSIEKLRDEEEQIVSYIADNKYNMTSTDTGLRYMITKEVPTGAPLKNGQTIAVNYTGKLLYFEGILDAKNKPTTTFDSGTFSFVLGSTGSIAGFDQGVSKLKVGEKGIIIMPSSLGYKDIGSGRIPAKSPLFFEIEVVSAQ